jgi:hypothetical protein
MSEKNFELFKAHRDGQDKIAYFLLTASGAGIGFAVTQTKDAWIGYSQIPLGLAIICWGLSFFFGCRYLRKVNNLLGSNYRFVTIKDKREIAAADSYAMQSIQTEMYKQNPKVAFASKAQFNLIIAGALFFLAWHVLEMYLRASSPFLGH